ncbi:MAG TPA: helix-turn-helix domain-containing protein [Chloroflexota bacterium]|nr:helix-turn-helix domain-containing protein [Chloroflexota bacterium]
MRIVSIADLADVVRGRRIELRMSQEEIARRIGVSRRWVWQIEAGKAAAELGLVLRLIQALDLAIDLHPADAADHVDGTPVDLDAHLARFRAR